MGGVVQQTVGCHHSLQVHFVTAGGEGVVECKLVPCLGQLGLGNEVVVQWQAVVYIERCLSHYGFQIFHVVRGSGGLLLQ